MKIAIIEPHYDDAWLNLGGHLLLHPEHEHLIISIARDQNNPIDLTAKLASRLPRLRTMALELRGLTWNEIVVQRELVEHKVSSYAELFLLQNGLTLSALTQRLEGLLAGYELVALPLGLFHPMHMVVSQLALSLPTLRYMEYPYAFFDSEQEAMQRLCLGQTLLTEKIAAVVKEKLRIFQEVYASQQFILTLSACKTPLARVEEERLYTIDPEAARRWKKATHRPSG